MAGIRQFLNSDVPGLLAIWQRQPALRGIARNVTAAMLEEIVFSRPWFDPEGLFIAEGPSGRIAGFIHAGFLPAPDGGSLDLRHGIISQLRLDSTENGGLGDELFSAALQWLRGRGALDVHAVSRYPQGPFYLGMYGGSRLPGILADDSSFLRLAAAAGFNESGQIGIFHKPLAGYRGLVDRRMSGIRRQFEPRTDQNPLPSRWWDAGQLRTEDHRTRFSLYDRVQQCPVATIMVWDMEPLASCQGLRAAGMFDLWVADQHRRAGLATCLLSEAMRVLSQDGIGVAEIQINLADGAAAGVLAKLGFQQVDMALQMSRLLQT